MSASLWLPWPDAGGRIGPRVSGQDALVRGRRCLVCGRRLRRWHQAQLIRVGHEMRPAVLRGVVQAPVWPAHGGCVLRVTSTDLEQVAGDTVLRPPCI